MAPLLEIICRNDQSSPRIAKIALKKLKKEPGACRYSPGLLPEMECAMRARASCCVRVCAARESESKWRVAVLEPWPRVWRWHGASSVEAVRGSDSPWRVHLREGVGKRGRVCGAFRRGSVRAVRCRGAECGGAAPPGSVRTRSPRRLRAVGRRPPRAPIAAVGGGARAAYRRDALDHRLCRGWWARDNPRRRRPPFIELRDCPCSIFIATRARRQKRFSLTTLLSARVPILIAAAFVAWLLGRRI